MRTICVKHISKEWNFLKTEKILKIDGTMLNKAQLEKHLEKIASGHNLSNKAEKETYPVPHLLES